MDEAERRSLVISMSRCWCTIGELSTEFWRQRRNRDYRSTARQEADLLYLRETAKEKV